MSSITMKRIALPVALALPLLLQGCTPSSNNQVGDSNAARRVPVTVTAVQERDFEERITVQGNLVAKDYAMVSPLVDGMVTELYVEEGDQVEKGAPLLQIDKETLGQAYEIALQDKVVAEHARIDAEAQVVAAQAQYDKAKLDYERFTRLREQQAITPDAMEQMEAGFTVAEAQLERAKTAVQLRKEQEKQVTAAVAIAKKRLDDSRVTSPIDGWISYRGIKPGEFAGAGRPVIRVADTSVLEVSAFLPGEYYPRIKTGETHMHVRVGGIDAGRPPVTYKSPEIQEQLRTFEVKGLIDSPPEGVVPGAIAQIETVLLRRTGPGIPHDVVQIREGRPVVFVVEDGHAREVKINTGLTTDGWTEVLDDTLPPGASVITRGYNLVNDGTPVDVRGEEN